MKMILKEIIDHKKQELGSKGQIDKAAIGASVRSFKEAISKPSKRGVNLIAEIKRASPSEGNLKEGFDIEEIAKIYEEHADAISVLTDERFFQGSLKDMAKAKRLTTKPILRKDFILNEYQIYEARKYGADAVLLIASILSKEEINRLVATAKKLNMDCIVEVHTKEELKKALETDAEIIGINNRNLDTLETDLNTTQELVKDIPEGGKGRVIVSESGISTAEDVEKLKGKVDAVLIGTAFIKAGNTAGKIDELLPCPAREQEQGEQK